MFIKSNRYTEEFKVEAAQLVTQQGYSFSEASSSLGIGKQRWVSQLQQESVGITPKTKASAPEQKRIKELEARIDRLERDKTILKKATALLTSEQIQRTR